MTAISVGLENRIRDMVDFMLPQYLQVGKSRLVLAFGCTGGKHRSITFAERAAEYYKKNGYSVMTVHRDMNKK